MIIRYILTVFILLAFPVSSAAGVLDRIVKINSTDQYLSPLDQTVRLHVENPDIIEVLQDDSFEITIKPVSAGSSFVFLHGENGLSVWRVFVDEEADEEERKAAIKKVMENCKSVENNESLEVFVDSSDCHAAVSGLSTLFIQGELRVRFNEIGLRAQLLGFEKILKDKGLDESLELVYVGANLQIRGKTDYSSLDALLRKMWSASAGLFLVNLSRIDISETSGEKK